MSCMALAGAVIGGGCATPAGEAYAYATSAGLEHRVLEGEGFRHMSHFRPGRAGSARLHIYIDHDGRPWLNGRYIAADPTPRNPLALRLMALDRGPALYLGRPCHFSLDASPPCHPGLWTHERYGEKVVSSMVWATQVFIADKHFQELVLIGYSGGGTLAMLMAERLPQTVAVVTLAGNLDIDAWTRLHEYTPLQGSLNPAERAPLSGSIRQVHYVGGKDRNVLPEFAHSYAARDNSAQVIELPGFDHVCCWELVWKSLLETGPF